MPSISILLCDHRGAGLERRGRELLARGHRVRVARTLRRSLAEIARESPDLILVDPLSRGRQGPEVELGALDAAREPRGIPLLWIADAEGALEALACARGLSGGPWDLAWREAGTEELVLRLERLQRAAEASQEMEVLRHRASHDDRTDLLRPKAFQQRLMEHFSAAQRHAFSLALVLVDLDRFGEINKRHDHTVGDLLIAQVGDVIHRALRKEDVAGRLGGDEFAVLLPYTKKLDASRVVRRLCAEIRCLSGRPPGSHEDLRVSASIGFETFDGTDLDSVHTLRRNAERALRAAKVRGGNQGVYYRSLAGMDLRGEEDLSGER
jgi:diguanylate cyclase (GGDEF)-like protein